VEIFELLFFTLIGIYSITVLSISIGLFRLPKSFKLDDIENLPTVAVIVSAKNEEQDILTCLESLEALTYDKTKLEIIVIDDQSTDSTLSLIEKIAQRNPHFKVLSTKDAPENKLRAKAKGIAWGIKNTDAEWIFITDADGAVHENWIGHMLSGVDETTGMIGGMVTVKDKSFLAILERTSWAYTLPFAFGMAGFGGEFICVGPNMALRKSIYDEAGGLENSDFKVAEDLALFRMVEKSAFGVKSYVSKETKVDLEPVPSLKHLTSQQRRWLKGGFEGGWKYWIGLVFAFGFNNLLSVLFIIGMVLSLKTTLILLVIKSFADFIMLLSEKILLKEKKMLRYFPFMEINVFITFMWLPISLLINSTIHWKGDNYTITYSGKNKAD
jgi:cellulose synthase/poly-beta-1,6-N-acetylglucosamine synthase-like glycosyltransferase